MNQDNRNMVVFVVTAVAILMIYQVFVLGPATKRREAEVKAAQAQAAAHVQAPAAPQAVITLSRAQALAQSPRVPIQTPSLKGSIALDGARIDDLYLTRYRETLAKTSPPVELLRPGGTSFAYFADFGWQGVQGGPDENTPWTLTQGQTLSPGHPVVLSYAAPNGLQFTRTIQVDNDYMFTISDQVMNHGAAQVTLAPFGTVQRHGLPPDLFNVINVHQGAVGFLGGSLQLSAYKDWKKKGQLEFNSTGGW
ncbi:MAG TPA: membrane protein insertase YidC, partial [Caulobacteraceae bacterium]|nr:membrane protein insertase YidC [Caulobacteraceae bacterium]